MRDCWSLLSGHPTLALRAGFEQQKSRPISGITEENELGASMHRVPDAIHLWGRLFEEGKLIAVARAVEAALGLHQERPPVA